MARKFPSRKLPPRPRESRSPFKRTRADRRRYEFRFPFFCALKNHRRSFRGGWSGVQILHFVQLESEIAHDFSPRALMKRSCASFGNDRCARNPIRTFTSNAITRVSERFNLRVAFVHARPISNFILFSLCVYLIRFASLGCRLIEDRSYSKKEERTRKKRSVWSLFEGKNEK